MDTTKTNKEDRLKQAFDASKEKYLATQFLLGTGQEYKKCITDLRNDYAITRVANFPSHIVSAYQILSTFRNEDDVIVSSIDVRPSQAATLATATAPDTPDDTLGASSERDVSRN